MAMTRNFRSIVVRFMTVVCGLISAFFVFYTIRLLYVTKGLTVIRAGGGGTYIGAVAFPVLAIAFGFASWQFLRGNKQRGKAQ